MSSVARGITASRPENIVGSLRISVAWIQAGLRGAVSASDCFAITMAQAPSDDGHVSR